MEGEAEPQEQKKPKGKVKRVIVTAVLLVLGLLFVASGGSILYYNLTYNNPDGFVYSNIYHVNTSTYAFTAYMNEYKISTWGFLGASNVAELKMLATPSDLSKELFIGYATTKASQAYSGSFEVELPTMWHWWAAPWDVGINITTTTHAGSGAPTHLPQTQTFWVASAQSHGTVSMTYLPQGEQFVWFIMNSDGSKNVSADIQIAFRSPILGILPYILLVLGIAFIFGGLFFFHRKKIKY